MKSRMSSYMYNELMILANEEKSFPDEKINQLLEKASKRKEITINKLIDYITVDVNKQDQKGDTLLTSAAYQGHTNLINFLLKTYNLDKNIKNDKGYNYLQCLSLGLIRLAKAKEYKKMGAILSACQYIKVPVVRNELGSRADYIVFNHLMDSIKIGDLKIINEIEDCFPPEAFDGLLNKIKDAKANTPLTWAAYHGQLHVVDRLIEFKADVSVRDQDRFDYLERISQFLVSLAKKSQYKSILNIIHRYKGITFKIKDQAGDSIETLLFYPMVNAVIAGNGDHFTQIQTDLPFDLFYYLINEMKCHDGHTLLTKAAYLGQLHIVDKLIECRADVRVKDTDQLNYLQNMSLFIVSLTKKKEYEQIGRIFNKYEGVTLSIEDDKGVSAEKIILNTLYDGIREGTFEKIVEKLGELKKASPHLKIFGESLGSIAQMIQLESAIIANDTCQVKNLLCQELLLKPLPKEVLPPLALAFKYNRSGLVQYLIQNGARLEMLPAMEITPRLWEIIRRYKVFDTGMDSLILNLKRDFEIEKVGLKLDVFSTMNKIEKEHSELAEILLSFIKKKWHQAIMLHPYEKLDLLILVSAVLRGVKETDQPDDLKKRLKVILGQREDAIAGSNMDYCYAPYSLPNRICYKIADQLGEYKEAVSRHNILLSRATQLDRAQLWFDPSEGVDATTLPEYAGDFFRLPDNQIHLYVYVVSQAIERLIAGNRLLEHVWFGTDPKLIKPVPPLQKKQLSILKGRSKTLRELVEWTEHLDRMTRISMESDVIQRFSVLRDGLYAGDYRETKDHYNAGSAAYACIASFSDWWNNLKQLKPDLCGRIKNLGDLKNQTEEKLGDVIDILLDVKNLKGERVKNAKYCVHLKANILDRALKNEKIIKELKRIQSEIKVVDEKIIVYNDQLRRWEQQILEELKCDFSDMIVHCNGQFPDMQYWELNYLLMQANAVDCYNDLVLGKDKNKDLDIILKYIYLENDLCHLKKLRIILNGGEYDYLHKLDSQDTSLFVKTFYAKIKGVERKTNQKVADLIHELDKIIAVKEQDSSFSFKK